LSLIKDSFGLLEAVGKVKNEVDEKMYSKYIQILLETKKILKIE
jgi:hypothetical protein